MRALFALARGSLASAARHPRTAVVLGRLLGTGFLVCFATGLYSHFLQDPLPGMAFLTRPASLYRITQGLHVATGIACIPLLLGKLYTVFPLLFAWPPARTVAGLLERASIALFVASSLVQLATGLVNTYQWYPWPFPFRQVHYALAWVIVASLAIHIGVKLPIITRWWRRRDSIGPDGRLRPVGTGEGRLGSREPRASGVTGVLQRWIERAPAAPDAVSRRTVLGAVGVATGAAVVLSVGQSLPALAAVNVFGPRQQRLGPQALPVNKTARAAGVVGAATDPGWVLTVRSGRRSRVLTRTDLLTLPQTRVTLPIACVEGWSVSADWRGVRVADLAALVGATGRGITVRSLQRGAYATTILEPEFAADPLTLVALELNGAPLDLDHGYPARIIAPARPGVLQTKWLSSLEAR
ncbi:molybdopterin-dependent oxidoreductase [Amnibacterium sp.]|uniref:molybdopterin-dependent oxidoreductase n=1 Tax=Amnibacterium sp. TaxID=1872496 RepID=UPI002605535F|nr:molybdopterin-dependent oxidoreductase [Amnibacterium sp.]MCU1473225.1 molybdopterin-binding protein [Amnibacterium sp.]